MAGVIVEKKTMAHGKIGVVSGSTGAVDYAKTLQNEANSLSNEFATLANIQAKKTGKELAESLQEYRTINPETGQPEAFSNMPTGFGTTATEAFAEVVDTQFETSITNEIDEISKRTAGQYPLDSEAYAKAFGDKIIEMKKYATGKYSNLIEKYSTRYLASTKLNILGKEIANNQKNLKEETINTNIKDAGKILNLYNTNASWSDKQKAIKAARGKLDVAREAQTLGTEDYHKGISVIESSRILGSIKQFVIKPSGLEQMPKLTAFVAYITTGNDTQLSQLQAYKSKIPAQYNDKGEIVVEEMSLAEYAKRTKTLLNQTRGGDSVIKELDGILVDLNKNRTTVVTALNDNNERLTQQTINKHSNSLNHSDKIFPLEQMDLKNTANNIKLNLWKRYLDNNLTEQKNMTQDKTSSSLGVNPKLSSSDAEKIETDNFKNILTKTLQFTIGKADEKVATSKLNVIKSLVVAHGFSQSYESMNANIKKTITKDEFNFISNTLKHLEKYDSNVKPNKVFELLADKTYLSYKSIFTETEIRKRDELAQTVAINKNTLKKDNDLAMSEVLNLGTNYDFRGQVYPNETNKFIQDLQNIDKFYEKERRLAVSNIKSGWDADAIDVARNGLKLQYFRGVMSNVVADLNEKYTFGEKERVLNKSDIQKMEVALNTGRINDSVPKEMHQLFKQLFKGNQVSPLEREATAKAFQEIEKVFVTTSSKTTAENKVKLALNDIKSKVNKTSKEHNKLVVDNMLGDEEEQREEGWEGFYINTPMKIDGKLNPVMSRMVQFAVKGQRLPASIVNLLNNVGNGSEKNTVMIARAIEYYKLLSSVEIANNNEYDTPEYLNVLKDKWLKGEEVSSISMTNINKAIVIAGKNESSTTSVIEKLQVYNDGGVRNANIEAFFGRIKAIYTEKKEGNPPTSLDKVMKKAMGNVLINQQLKPWAENLIATTDGLTEADFINEYQTEIQKRYTESTIVYDFRNSYIEKGKFYSINTIKDYVPSKKGMANLLTIWENSLKDGYSFGGQINNDTIGVDTIEKQDASRSGNLDIPVYLMPVNSDPNNKVFRAITIEIVGNQKEITYLEDLNGDGYLEFTIDDATMELVNNDSDMNYDQIAEAQLKNIDKKLEGLGGMNLSSAEFTTRVKELQKQRFDLKEEIKARGRNREISSNSSAQAKFDGTNVADVSSIARKYLQVAEGLVHVGKADNSMVTAGGFDAGRAGRQAGIGTKKDLKSWGYGTQIKSMTVEELKLVKNKKYITEPEARAVLTLRIKTIRGTWQSVFKKANGEFGKLPAQTRVALISMGYQLDMTNILSNVKGRGWPTFLKHIKEASTHDFNSEEQKKALKEAQIHMQFNFKNGKKTGVTAWFKTTNERATIVQEMMGGQ